MNTHNLGENRPEASHGAEGEVVTRGASMSPLSKFAERIRKSVKEAFNIHVNERLNTITFWVNDIFVELEPQLEDSELIYTTIELTYFTDQLKTLGRFYISSIEIKFEDEYRTLTAKFENVEEDPKMLVEEEELIDYLNELSKIGDLDEFIQFAQEEFKTWSGLD
jgi:hypothetical protein